MKEDVAAHSQAPLRAPQELVPSKRRIKRFDRFLIDKPEAREWASGLWKCICVADNALRGHLFTLLLLLLPRRL